MHTATTQHCCPHCRSKNIEKEGITIVEALPMGAGADVMQYKCRDCGTLFYVEEG